MLPNAQYVPSLVVVGAFNPAIIRPEWLMEQKLIPTVEKFEVEFAIGAPQHHRFEAGGIGWTVSQTRLHMESKGDDEAVTRVAVGLLKALRHTPVNGVGINLNVKVPSATWTAERPTLPGHFEERLKQFGQIVSKSHIIQAASTEGVVLNMTIRQEPDHSVIDLNYHNNALGTDAAIKVLGKFNSQIEIGKKLVNDLAVGASP